jgi:quercetin dioxygenase-like cupin family protein
MYVVEGRGSTEVWQENSSRKKTFEWQAGSLFMIPINTHHRLVNAASSPALVLAATNAPPIMNVFQSRRFIFENPYEFRERYDESEDFFKAREELEPDPFKGRAILRSNIFHDIVNCELPLDNQRAPGYRRFQPFYHGFQHDAGSAGGFIAEYPSGRYSKAHHHQARAVLVCLRGKGYTYNWSKELGPRPWEAGKGHLVRRQDYIPGGLVAAAPGGGDWFHQHFGVAKENFRILNFWGGPTPDPGRGNEDADKEVVSANIYGMEEGGVSINYRNEDPHILSEYKLALEREGGTLQMPESLYR